MNSKTDKLTSEEILVLDFFNFIIKNHRLIAIVTALTVGFTLVIYLAKPNFYMADATVLPVLEKTTNQEKSAAIPAALMNLTGQKSEQKAVILATLESRNFVDNYLKKSNILQHLFPSAWDAKKNKWKYPEKEPSPQQAYEKFDELFAVTQSDSKEYFTLSLKWTDPQLAAIWLNQLIDALNDHFREKTISTSEKNIAYLNEQIQRNSVIEVRQNLSELLQREILKNMIAQNEKAYALDIIDKATTPEKKYSPKFLLHIGLGLILGVILGIIMAFGKGAQILFRRLFDYIKNHRK